MICHTSRSCASRLWPRFNLCQLDSNLCKLDHVAVATTAPLSSSSTSLLDREFPSTNSRHFSSSFKKSLMQNQLTNERTVWNSKEGVSRNSKRENGRVKQNNHRHGHRNEHQRNQRPNFHSVRLINESAARQTTQLFLEAYGSSQPYISREDNDTPPWQDAATLVAAEHALEFWAHRNNHRRDQRQQQPRRQNNQSKLEEDADGALHLFTALHHFHCQDGLVLTNGMYSHVIDALAKSPNLNHVYKADALLRQFIALYIEHDVDAHEKKNVPSLLREIEFDDSIPTNEISVNFGSKQPLTNPGYIKWNNVDKHHFPNQIRITGVMRGYARQCHPDGAESLLRLMISLSTLGGNKRMFRPNEVGFATVIDAYSRLHDGPNAERVLQLMKKRSFDKGAAVDDEVLNKRGMARINGANVVAYNATISAWARSAKQPSTGDDAPLSMSSQAAISSSRAAAQNSERLLREMLSEHDSRHKHSRNTVLPDVVTYSTVISAYATCLDQPYGMKRARELLTELEGLAAHEYNESHDTNNAEQNSTPFRGNGGGRHPRGFQPNTVVYNTILQAYANAGDASTAETILHSMISLHSSSLQEGAGGPYQHVCPNTRTFNVVLNAWAKKNGGEGGVRANEILDRLENMASINDGPRPDTISYNTVLAAWSKSASVDPASLSDREDSIIVGKGAAYEAMKLLDKVELRYIQSQGNQYGRRHPHVTKPDAISYNTTIAAFANAAQHCKNGTSMAEEAESLLSRMKDQLGIDPDSYSYNGVLSAWARSSGGLSAAQRAESILRAMRDPTIVSWSAVVNAYAHADSAPKAETLLREMEQNAMQWSRGSRAPIIPSVVLYNNVLHAWGSSSDIGASKHAEVLLNRMENSSQLPMPDIISYRLVLTALEHSMEPDKAERSKSVLGRLLSSVELQNIVANPPQIQNAYNSLLTACAYTPADATKQHRDKAARILVETLRDVNQFSWPADDSGVNGPNQESYALFLQGCTHLLDPDSEERNILLKSAFHECCQKGLLNRNIWDKFYKAMGPERATIFIQGFTSTSVTRLNFDQLPDEWSSSSLKR